MPPDFLPPATHRLEARLAARNLRRARRVLRRLLPHAAGWRRGALAALDACLSMRGRGRAALLLDPGLRAWLAAAEESIVLTDPRAGAKALFDVVARGPHMAEVMPAGRLDARFRSRAAALGRRLRGQVFLRLAPLLAYRTPPRARFGPFPLDLSEDGEEARRAGELHLALPVPATLRLAPGARLELGPGWIRILQRGPAPRWTPRPAIRGSDLVLGRRAIATRRGLRAAPPDPAAARKLGRALAILSEVWDEGRREVLAHTRVVVPLTQRGTVSFSLPDRPGISFINLSGKSPADLADDLIHETAHHRLHGLEEMGPLVRDDGEPRYWSAWRRSLRPLHGILHAAYTFTWRAELLARLLGRPGLAPRRWIERELAFEREALRSSLADLADADRRGLLTPAGSALRRALARRVGRFSAGRPSRGAPPAPGSTRRSPPASRRAR